MLALVNAREKAMEVCRLVGQNLGRPVFITENIVREWTGSEEEGPQTPDSPSGSICSAPNWGPIPIKKQLQDNAVTIRVDVTATFEIKSLKDKKQRHRKEKKEKS